MARREIRRREFLKAVGLGTAAVLAPRGVCSAAGVGGKGARRPNIVWISTEDISPTLGCYGDAYATTPNLDRFAGEGVRYDAAFAHAPVCAPARSGITTGMYPTRIGTSWMRCRGVPPVEARCFPEYLRAAGYYCTNRSKTDYQFAPPASAWDECGGRGHWRTRRDKDQPFFSVFNLGVTHESSTRRWTPGKQVHDPAKAPLPPYWPDTPIVRQNLACYYDRMTELDGQVQAILDELKADGLTENTIVWFWGDHGWGLTRGKRWIYDSGLRVPLMVRVPESLRDWAGGGKADLVAPKRVEKELVSFIDFAPTVLSLAGVKVPPHMQGQAFLGPQRAAAPREYIFGARDRMDETIDCIRALRDKRYKYIRNFMPYVTRGQHIAYMDRTPILQEMRRLHAAGKLPAGPQMQYFEPTKPVHELYDTTADPHEVHNLAGEAKHKPVLDRMSAALKKFMLAIGDVGLIPESDFDAMKGSGTAARPALAVAASGEGKPVSVTMSCLTPGASIVYQVTKDPAGRAGGTFLRARDARIEGKGAKKTGDAITNYRGKDTSIRWQVELPRAGRQSVYVLQANAGRGGSTFELTVGEAKVTGTIRHTRTWDDYVYVKVGEVQVPKPGKYVVRITPTKQVDGRLGNVSAVVIGGKNLPKARRTGNWLLYNRPVALAPGQAIRAQAWRLGYKPSAVVTLRHGDKPPAPEKPAETGMLWREALDRSDLLERLLALKEYDGRYAAGVGAFLKALSDKEPAMRYWAAVGLQHGCATAASIARARPAVEALLGDPSASVRVAAGQALCAWGAEAKGLPVLIEVLKGPSEKGALYAATALLHLGEKARAVLGQIRSVKLPRYPGAVAQRVVAQLSQADAPKP